MIVETKEEEFNMSFEAWMETSTTLSVEHNCGAMI